MTGNLDEGICSSGEFAAQTRRNAAASQAPFSARSGPVGIMNDRQRDGFFGCPVAIAMRPVAAKADGLAGFERVPFPLCQDFHAALDNRYMFNDARLMRLGKPPIARQEGELLPVKTETPPEEEKGRHRDRSEERGEGMKEARKRISM